MNCRRRATGKTKERRQRAEPTTAHETPGTAPDNVTPIDRPLDPATQLRLKDGGKRLAQSWVNLPQRKHEDELRPIFESAASTWAGLQQALSNHAPEQLSKDLKWMSDNFRLFATSLLDVRGQLKTLRRLPMVRTQKNEELPRVWFIAWTLIVETQVQITERTISAFVSGVEEIDALEDRELWALSPLLKLALLVEGAHRGQQAFAEFASSKPAEQSVRLDRLVGSLKRVSDINGEELLEPLSIVDSILREDPAGLYPRMDDESRQRYRGHLC